MAPETLKALSLRKNLAELFEQAKEDRNYSLNALPEEDVANWLVEELAPVLVRLDDFIEAECARRSRARAARAA